jgi:hypothetical protein
MKENKSREFFSVSQDELPLVNVNFLWEEARNACGITAFPAYSVIQLSFIESVLSL